MEGNMRKNQILNENLRIVEVVLREFNQDKEDL